MKQGTSKNTTTIITNSSIGKNAMMDVCLANSGDGLIDENELYAAWCREIDSALDGTGFWHTPGTSELCGPVDSEMETDEFEQIMNTSFDRAAAGFNE